MWIHVCISYLGKVSVKFLLRDKTILRHNRKVLLPLPSGLFILMSDHCIQDTIIPLPYHPEKWFWLSGNIKIWNIFTCVL